MPPLTRMRVSALAELSRQLRFVPVETARRHVERAEALLARLERGTSYPEDWVVFQVTGYRPEIAEPALIVGDALIADLAGLVERLSVGAKYKQSELERGQWIRPAELAARWSVSARTLSRLKRLGLLARRVLGLRGKPVTLYALPSIERLEHDHAARLRRAGAYRRVGEDERGRIVAEVTAKASTGRGARGRAVGEAAGRTGRALQTVRRALRAAGLERARPVLDARRRGALLKMMRAGAEPRAMAARFGKSAAAVHRAAHQARADALRGLDLGPGFEPARDVNLLDERHTRAPEAGVALGRTAETTVGAHVRAARDAGWPDAAVEQVRARAFASLRALCARDIARLDRYAPAAAMLDLIETRLRWAARLKAELIRSEQMLTLKTIEGRLSRPVESLPGAAALSLILACIGAVADAVDRHDPFKGGRLASPAGMTLNRAVARWEAGPGAPWSSRSAASAPGRAEPRTDLDHVALPDWTRSVAPWQEFLEPDEAVRPALAGLNEDDRSLLEWRYGWSGERPRTLAELCGLAGVPRHVMARRERTALRRAMGIA